MPNLKKNFTFSTGQTDTRRCIKCGTVCPKRDFLIPESPAQARIHNRGTKDIPGVLLCDGTFLRGHRRPQRKNSNPPILVLGFKCPPCRERTPKTRHPKRGKTFQAVMQQMRKTQRRINRFRFHYMRGTGERSQQAVDYYHALNALIKRGKSLARQRGRRGGKCPDRWELMLTEGDRSELYRLHAGVLWPRRIPPIY